MQWESMGTIIIGLCPFELFYVPFVSTCVKTSLFLHLTKGTVLIRKRNANILILHFLKRITLKVFSVT